MDRIIIHIDFDSFFASVEQQYNPFLRGRPIGVIAKNGRTCIIASSREAKKLGIKTGSRSWEAKKIYPKVILVPADFNKYWEISRKFLKICSCYSPFVELFSIDEVFIDISPTLHLFENSPYKIIYLIKERIKYEIGEYITASVGISHNRLLAKMASGLNKPNGVFKVDTSNIDEVYEKAKLTDVCGIGEKMAIRLNKLGIYNLLQIRDFPFGNLEKEFGHSYSQTLKNIGMGADFSPIVPYYHKPKVKSVGRNYCLPRNEYAEKIIFQNIYELCEEVSLKLRRLNKKARTFGISLRGSYNIHGRKTADCFSNNGRDMFNAVIKIIYERIYPSKIVAGKEKYVRQISIWAENLEDEKNLTLSLFDFNKKKEKLIAAVDKINDKFGDHTIRNGFLLYSSKLTTVPNGYMADKYERARLAQDSS